MSERHHHHSPEKHKPVETAELQSNAAEHLKHLETKAERSHENKHELVEKAREAIKQTEPHQEQAEPAEPVHRTLTSGLSRRLNYQQTMVTLQQGMKPLTRSFSKFIHNPTVEQVSEVVGKTAMRPSVSLGATTTALLVGGFVYLSARAYGFSLHGPEILVAFLAGGLIGLLAEALIKLIRQATR